MLFIIPWSEYYIGRSECDFAHYPERAPEGVVRLATYLKNNGAEIRIADMQYLLRKNCGSIAAAMEALWGICLDFTPEVIGFSFFTARFEFTSDIFFKLKARYAEATLTLPLLIGGGVHPTLLPSVTLRYIPFDAVIIGEGERPLEELLALDSWVNLGKIPGVFTAYGGAAEHGEILEDLDKAPIPDWTLIDKEYYSQPSYLLSGKRLDRVMPISFSRSCAYRCNFCAHNCFLKARCHSAEYFLEMMDDVASQCNVDTFIIQDSSIGNFKKEWSKVCQELIRRGSPYKWWANLRANQADEGFLTLLRDAGCIKLFFGFESGSQRILDRMGKRITVEQCERAADLCHKLDIDFYTSYIINYFGETDEDLELTEKLIRRTRPTTLAINRFSPIPGSKDYELHKVEIDAAVTTLHDWTNLGMLNLPLHFGNMPSDRYAQWERSFRELKRKINRHEGIDD